MSQKEIKAIYESLKSSGDLHEMFPGLTGEWAKDKKQFTKQYEDNESLLKEDRLDLDEQDHFLNDDSLLF